VVERPVLIISTTKVSIGRFLGAGSFSPRLPRRLGDDRVGIEKKTHAGRQARSHRRLLEELAPLQELVGRYGCEALGLMRITEVGHPPA